ncbi:hypothetical protein [Pseudonocardia dioxanivorans]|uniref:hypothetical protein n=1 Tax=Pseudonocardia dioxanivorans TaxID=240495 RepID=UPI00104B3AE8|nr:hypothetical protein [Pseudonocardia dioxanivorans]
MKLSARSRGRRVEPDLPDDAPLGDRVARLERLQAADSRENNERHDDTNDRLHGLQEQIEALQADLVGEDRKNAQAIRSAAIEAARWTRAGTALAVVGVVVVAAVPGLLPWLVQTFG